MDNDLTTIGHARHAELIALLDDLDSVEDTHGTLNHTAHTLRAAIWPFLQAYGVRDEHGSVDTTLTTRPRTA